MVGKPESLARAGRRQEHAEDTRRALLDVARRAFAERGYGGTSLDDIVGRAGLTKGALYHHFSSKAALFEALYVAMASEVALRVTSVLAIRRRGAWDRMLAAIDAFFDASAEPDYVRIVLQDAPTVLGAQRGRELDHAIGLSLICQLLDEMAGEGRLPPLPIETTARILLAAVSEVAITMAYSDYPGRVRSEGQRVIIALLEGLMAKAKQG